MTLDPQLKSKWVAALRSGEYKQGKGCLRGGDGSMCCLGVGCVVNGADETFLNYNNETTDEAAYLIGISYLDAKELATLNDKRDQTFPQIADYIEANF